jgi:hypothetical protein
MVYLVPQRSYTVKLVSLVSNSDLVLVKYLGPVKNNAKSQFFSQEIRQQNIDALSGELDGIISECYYNR